MSDTIIITAMLCATAIAMTIGFFIAGNLSRILSYLQNRRREKNYLKHLKEDIDQKEHHSNGIGNFKQYIDSTEKSL